MSYTLTGRIELRLAATFLPLLMACGMTIVYHDWWPFQLIALMLGVGAAFDALVLHRLLPYQPGWAAVPLGALELVLVMGAARLLHLQVERNAAIALFAAGWLSAQVLAHAGLPLLRLSYAEDGGELGRAGAAVLAGVAACFALAGGVAWATQPPTVVLSAGVHKGPIVIDRTETLVGEPGAIVRGGIVVRADDVVVRDVTVEGGDDGIKVEHATNVLLDRVHVRGARLDGINVRRAHVTIRDCTIEGLRSPYAQGIDISFSFDMATSMVEGCTVRGGQEGIVGDWAQVEFRNNRIEGTTMRAITLNEMSMGMVEQNHVRNAVGIGIFCGDMSECEIERNRVTGVAPDHASADRSRRGYGVVAYDAVATIAHNRLEGAALPAGAFAGGRVVRD
jgi:hypothetical protein